MKEYLTELREFHRVGDGSGSRQISVGDVVTVHQDKCPRQKWNIGLVNISALIQELMEELEVLKSRWPEQALNL